MFRSQARVAAPKPAQAMTQLAKHFAHKITVEIADAEARATFPDGECTMVAGETLDLACAAKTEAALHRIEEIVGGHLERFLWRTPTPVTWEAAR
jgi:hypothetical protein